MKKNLPKKNQSPVMFYLLIIFWPRGSFILSSSVGDGVEGRISHLHRWFVKSDCLLVIFLVVVWWAIIMSFSFYPFDFFSVDKESPEEEPIKEESFFKSKFASWFVFLFVSRQKSRIPLKSLLFCSGFFSLVQNILNLHRPLTPFTLVCASLWWKRERKNLRQKI